MFADDQSASGDSGAMPAAAGDHATRTPSAAGDGEKSDPKGPPQDALRRLGEQRDAARTELKTAQDELAALRKEKAQREQAEAEVKDEQAAARGEFEKLAAKRTAERDEARAEATRLSATLDQYKSAMEHGLDAAYQALPEELRKLWKGAEEDVLGKFMFVHDPDLATLARQLEQRAAAIRGNGHDPRSSIGGRTSSDEAARKAQAAMYRQL